MKVKDGKNTIRETAMSSIIFILHAEATSLLSYHLIHDLQRDAIEYLVGKLENEPKIWLKQPPYPDRSIKKQVM